MNLGICTNIHMLFLILFQKVSIPFLFNDSYFGALRSNHEFSLHSKGSIYFACTNGGIKKRGQIWKLTGEKIELFAEPNNPDLVDNCDNITVSPWGDLFICEDGKGEQFIDVITPQG